VKRLLCLIRVHAYVEMEIRGRWKNRRTWFVLEGCQRCGKVRAR
jgi:hypothetical protein